MERTPVKFTAKMNATIDATIADTNQQLDSVIGTYLKSCADALELPGKYKPDMTKREYVPVEDKPTGV